MPIAEQNVAGGMVADHPLRPSIDHSVCKKCQFHSTCESKFYRGRRQSKKPNPVMVVFEYPQYADDPDEPFQSDITRWFYAKCKEAKIDEIDDAYVTYAVKCVPEGKLNGTKVIKSCSAFIHQEIAKRAPRLIICVGNRSLISVLGKSGINKARMQKHVYTSKLNNQKYPVVIVTNPISVLSERGSVATFDSDLEFVRKVLRNRVFDHNTIRGLINPSVKYVERMIDLWSKNSELVALDYETNSLDVAGGDPNYRCFILGLSDGTNTFALEIDKCGLGESGKRIANSIYYKSIKRFLEEPRIRKIAHNSKYEMHVSKTRFGSLLKGVVHDSMVLHSMVKSSLGGHDLGTAVSGMFNVPNWKSITEPWVGEETDAKKFADVPLEPLAKRCMWDTYWTNRLFRRCYKLLRKEEFVSPASGTPTFAMISPVKAYELLMKTNVTLWEIESRGVKFDVAYSQKLSSELGKEAKEALKILRTASEVVEWENKRWAAEYNTIMRAAKTRLEKFKTKQARDNFTNKLPGRIAKAKAELSFNPNSTQQIAEILFTSKHGFRIDYESRGIRLTETGKVSTDAETLTQIIESIGDRPYLEEDEKSLNFYRGLAKEDKLVRFILAFWDYCSADKNCSTFVDGLRDQAKADGIVHTTYNVGRARTWRLSSSDPNLQNIPTDQPRSRFKRQFIARPKYRLVEWDYKQIELMVLAAMSGDKTMCHAYRTGGDTHNITARRMFSLGEKDEVSEDQRRRAKTINFGIVYGETARGLAKTLRCDQDTAQDWINGYYETYPGVRRWHEKIMAYAEKNGRVYTWAGTWRNIPNAMIEVTSRDEEYLKAEAMRQVINTPVQGSAGYAVLLAMNEMREIIPVEDVRPVTTVHDSIGTEILESKFDHYFPVVKAMIEEAPMKLFGPVMRGIKLQVDAKVSTDGSWGAMEKYKVAA